MEHKPKWLATLNKAIENMGGLSAAAAELSVSVQTIQNWRTRGVAAKRVIAVATKGKVNPKHLRPDLYV